MFLADEFECRFSSSSRHGKADSTHYRVHPTAFPTLAFHIPSEIPEASYFETLVTRVSDLDAGV
jgi:hypothetical protein